MSAGCYIESVEHEHPDAGGKRFPLPRRMVALENGKFVLRQRNPPEPSRLLLPPGVRRTILLASLLFACTQLVNRTDLLESRSVSTDDLLLLKVAEEANVKPAVADIGGSSGVPVKESRQPDKEEDASIDDVSAKGNGNSTIDSDEYPPNDSEVTPKDDGDDGTN